MRPIGIKEARALIGCDGPEVYELLARANRARIAHTGMTVKLCGVLNAKSGLCPEDCQFCPQSVHAASQVDVYPLVSAEAMVTAARTAAQNRSARFGIVTSGESIENDAEVTTLVEAVSRIASELAIKPCASLGLVTNDVLQRLKEAGLTRYHCNLEAAESFFGNICTTHKWSDSAETIRRAKALGLSTCSGGIFGMGESPDQRVELLKAIRELDVDSVPLNFLNPIPGTPLADAAPIAPIDCLKVTAVARLMMPDKTIRICGGREHNLKDLQSWLLIAGADGLMVGGYLTTKGRNVADDLRMIADAGFNLTP